MVNSYPVGDGHSPVSGLRLQLDTKHGHLGFNIITYADSE